MRALPVALAISAAIHGGAVAYVETRPLKREAPRLVTLQPIEIVHAKPIAQPDPEPMVVALLDDHSVPAATGRGARAQAPKSSRVSTTTRAITTTQPGTVEQQPEHAPERPRNSLMTMRHPEIERGPSQSFMEKFMANTKPLKPKAIAGEQLADEIASAEGNLRNPRWVANASPDQLTAERLNLMSKKYERNNAELQPDGAGKKAEHTTFTVKVAPDGTAKINDKKNWNWKSPLSAEFDVTDAMMRRKGIDPYASYKLKVLDETRDERVAIGKQYRTQQLAQSKQIMQKNLERLVAMQPSTAELKQGLFELWDDCAESGSEELVSGAKRAREHVVGFIRSRLPATGPDAFTTAELARFNRHRRSQTTFAPYGE